MVTTLADRGGGQLLRGWRRELDPDGYLSRCVPRRFGVKSSLKRIESNLGCFGEVFIYISFLRDSGRGSMDVPLKDLDWHLRRLGLNARPAWF